MATISVDLNDLPYKLEYNCVAGDTLPLLLQLQINSVAVNLTNCTLRLAGTKPDGTAITARDITPSQASSGSFDGGLTSAETAAMTVGEARHEVECTFPEGDTNFSAGAVKTLIQATTNITADTA